MKITIQLNPVTKKNSQQIIKIKNRYMIIPSKQYKQYEKDVKQFMPILDKPISDMVNVKCLYYMKTKRRIDLNNLLEATTDILVKYKVLEDDNSKIVASHDGSRVYYDKDNHAYRFRVDNGIYSWKGVI